MSSYTKTKRTYGTSGNWKKEDPTRCIKEIWNRGIWIVSHQCTRKRGHGPKGLYCKQHAKGLGE